MRIAAIVSCIPMLILISAAARADDGPPAPIPGFAPDGSWAEVKESEAGAGAGPPAPPPEVRPNTVFKGSFAAPGEVDVVVLRIDEDAVLSLGFFPEPGVAFGRIDAPSLRSGVPLRDGGAVLHRLRVRAGTHAIRMECARTKAPGAYRLLVQGERAEPGWEVEPNDKPGERAPFVPGEPYRAWFSHAGDNDRFVIAVERRAIHRLTLRLIPPADARTRHAWLEPVCRLGATAATAVDPYWYRVDLADEDEYVFYPVLDRGEHELFIAFRSGRLGDAYEIRVDRFEVGLTAEDEAAARRALERGIARLLSAPPLAGSPRHRVAHLGLELMALVDGGPPALDSGFEGGKAPLEAEARARRVAAAIDELAALLRPAPGGSWAGAPVQQLHAETYDNAIGTLALADALAAGHEKARAACVEGTRFLLAAQLSPERAEAWGTVKSGPHLGGWRYRANAATSDISVTGWCLIALYAADVAGVEVPGLARAADRALAFVKDCSDDGTGFRYDATTIGRPTSVQQSIGALLQTLFDTASGARERALADLDRHLCAGTQTGHGDDSPLYYWYYATRAHYLRGGYPWEAWRHVTIRQLLRRQREDGSFAALGKEASEGERFATAVAVLILRLCLNEAPAYLRREVQGF